MDNFIQTGLFTDKMDVIFISWEWGEIEWDVRVVKKLCSSWDGNRVNICLLKWDTFDSVLVWCGYCNKLAWTWFVKKTEICSLTVLEVLHQFHWAKVKVSPESCSLQSLWHITCSLPLSASAGCQYSSSCLHNSSYYLHSHLTSSFVSVQFSSAPLS